MFALTIPSPAPLRAAAFDLLAGAPSVPASILLESGDHRSAVRELVLELADAAEAGPLEVTCVIGAEGRATAVVRDVWLLVGLRLAA